MKNLYHIKENEKYQTNNIATKKRKQESPKVRKFSKLFVNVYVIKKIL